MSRNLQKHRIAEQSESVSIFASVKANRALIVLGMLALITIGFGAIAKQAKLTFAHRQALGISSTAQTALFNTTITARLDKPVPAEGSG
jgi:hypothetical protein